MKLCEIKFALGFGRIIIPELNTNLLWSSVTITKLRNFSSETHYDTLGISPEATNSEIKSAYYEKTKQYHPDVNSSEKAKKKFQNISTAYETLSNYDERKKYDRTLIVNQGSQKNRPRYEQYSRYRASEHPLHRPTAPPKHNIYDFDMWYKEHYTHAFYLNQQQKVHRDSSKKEEKLHIQDNAKTIIQIYFALFFGFTILLTPLVESCIVDPSPKSEGKD